MKRKDESLFDDIFETLKGMPFWVGPLVAAIMFLFLRYFVLLLIPVAKPGAYDSGTIVRLFFPAFAWIITAMILVAWLWAELHKLFNRRLLDTRSSLSSLGDISWREFENLVSEAYRRQGYVTEVVGNSCGDGGVDIRLTRFGSTVLVQCKQWKAWKVGVKEVREMLGVVVSERASKGIVVSSGGFTVEARRFAKSSNPLIQLIDGRELLELIRSVQSKTAIATGVREESGRDLPSSPACPTCGTVMVLRTARKGENPGSQFWGCSRYPDCRGTRPLIV